MAPIALLYALQSISSTKMSAIPPDGPPAGSSPKPKPSHGITLHCRELARTIASAERTIRGVLASPDLLLALAPVGYNELAVNEGLKLFVTSQATFTARQEAMAVARLATKAMAMAVDIAKTEFTDYRTTVLSHFGDTEWLYLGATVKMPTGGAKFSKNARCAYNRALQEPYSSVLANHGFTPKRLRSALSVLDKLNAADDVRRFALTKVRTATVNRDNAADALADWVNKLRATANLTLGGRPALLGLLKD